jgi:hypothetical protein
LYRKFDFETLIWAFRNAGGDKIITVNQILRLGFSNTDEKTYRKIQRALTDVLDEAEQEGDRAMFEIFKEIKNSQTVVALAQRYG